jgi:hypothetical protein
MSLFNQKWSIKSNPFSGSKNENKNKTQLLVEQMRSTIEKNKGAALDASIEKEARKRPKLEKVVIGKKNKFSKILIPQIMQDKQKENDKNKTLAEALSLETSIEETINEEEVTQTVEQKQEEKFNPPDHACINVDDLIDALSVVAKYCLNVKKEISFLSDSIHNTDYETSDFLHSIELSSFDEVEKAKVFDKLSEIRQRRRSYKKRLELLTEVQTFVDKTSDIATKLGTLKNSLIRVKEKQNNAVFHTKIRNDVKEDEYVRIGTKV